MLPPGDWTVTISPCLTPIFVAAPELISTRGSGSCRRNDDGYNLVDDWNNLAFHVSQGHLVVTEGSFEGGPPDYFVCPLLPVKD